MGGEKGFHFRGVGLARGGIDLRGEQQIAEARRIPDREDRDVDHRGSPFLPVWRPEAHGHGEDLRFTVRGEGFASGDGEATDDRNAPALEDDGLGDLHPVTVAVEVARDAHAFRMVAPKSREDAIHLLKRVDETGLSKAGRR